MNSRGFMIEYLLLQYAFFAFLFILWPVTGTVIPSLAILVYLLWRVYRCEDSPLDEKGGKR